MYSEDEMLMLSGIQHYRFCPRQWALIHIEQQWADNRLTMEGEVLHKHVDDAAYRQKCGDNICLRSVSIASHELGLYGLSDVIELHPTDDVTNSITHPKYPGRWLPYPVEYKHGRPKKNEVDEVQLANVWCYMNSPMFALSDIQPVTLFVGHASYIRFLSFAKNRS